MSSFRNSLFNTIHSSVVVGGATYMAYKFLRSWILPKFFDIPDSEQEKVNTLQSQVIFIYHFLNFLLNNIKINKI